MFKLANQLGIPGMNTGTFDTSGAPSFQLAEVGSTTGPAPNNPQATGPQYGAGLNVNRCNCPLDRARRPVSGREQLDQDSWQPLAEVRSRPSLCAQSARTERQRPYRHPLFQQPTTSNPNLAQIRRTRLCDLRAGRGDQLPALRQHFNQCEGVPEALLLLWAGHLESNPEADGQLRASL